MSWKHVLISLPLWCVFSQQGKAENLAFYLEEAGKNNLTLQAKYLEYQAFLERGKQAGYLLEPSVSIGVFAQSVETRAGPQTAKIGVQQQLPWFGTIEQKKKLARNQADLKKQEYLIAKNELFLQLKSSWYRMITENQKLALIEDNLQILETYHQIATKQMEAGAGDMVDIIRIEMKKQALETELQLVREKLLLMQSQFNLLCHAEEARNLKFPDTVDNQAEISENFTDPTLAYFSLQLEGVTLKKELAKKQFMPSFGVGIDYVFVGSSSMETENSGKDAIMPMMSLQVPIYRTKYKSNLKELQYIEESLQFSKKALEQSLEGRILGVDYEQERFDKMLRLYQEQTQKLEQTIDILLTSYSSSGKNFEGLLKVQEELLQYQLAILELQQDYRLALAEKEAIMGREHEQQ